MLSTNRCHKVYYVICIMIWMNVYCFQITPKVKNIISVNMIINFNKTTDFSIPTRNTVIVSKCRFYYLTTNFENIYTA